MPVTNTEIAIIGGGVIGNSIAYHLARQGQRVLVIERAAIASEPAASWASAGGVRRQGRHPAEAQLANEAIQRWPTLTAELEADLHYRQGGQLLLAESDSEATGSPHTCSNNKTWASATCGSKPRRSPPARARPQPAGHRGQLQPRRRAGQPAAHHTRLRAGRPTPRRHLLDQHRRALPPHTHASRVTGIRTTQGDIAAQHTILAAGAWSDELALSAGLRLPIRTVALQTLLSTPAQPAILNPQSARSAANSRSNNSTTAHSSSAAAGRRRITRPAFLYHAPRQHHRQLVNRLRTTASRRATTHRPLLVRPRSPEHRRHPLHRPRPRTRRPHPRPRLLRSRLRPRPRRWSRRSQPYQWSTDHRTRRPEPRSHRAPQVVSRSAEGVALCRGVRVARPSVSPLASSYFHTAEGAGVQIGAALAGCGVSRLASSFFRAAGGGKLSKNVTTLY